MEVSRKLKTETPCDPVIPHVGMYLKKNENIYLKRYTYLSVHSKLIYNCQGMEAT